MPQYDLPYDLALREATVEDIPAIHDMYLHAAEATDLPFEVGEMNEELKTFYTSCINSPDCLVLLLVTSEKPVGVLVASKLVIPLFKTASVNEILWWVEPEGRKGIAPLRMIQAMEEWGKLNECTHVKLGLLSNMSRKQTKRLHKIYRKKGYKPFSTTYYKELD